MEQDSNDCVLIAWITRTTAGDHLACYLGIGAPGRAPAVRLFPQREPAAAWIAAEAAALGVGVRMVAAGYPQNVGEVGG